MFLTMVHLQLRQITELNDTNPQKIDNLEKWMERVDTPYIEDKTLENAIYEEGISYFQGEESLEEAVNEIEKKMSLYLAE